MQIQRGQTDLFQEVESEIGEIVCLRDTSEAEGIFRFDIGVEAEPSLEEFEEMEQAEVILLRGCTLLEARRYQTHS